MMKRFCRNSALLLVAFVMMSFNLFKGGEEVVEISTDQGTILLWLYKDTPKHRENFLKLVKEGFYNQTTFHRVIKDFMIQGGDPNTKDPAKANLAGQGGPGYTIDAELNVHHYHKRGVLAAARQGDRVNPDRKSSGSQFYIVQGKKATPKELNQIEKMNKSKTKLEGYKMSEKAKYDYENIGGTPFLDAQYTVFGEVISGMDVVDKIANVKKDRTDKPKQDVKMTIKVLRLSKKKLKNHYHFNFSSGK